MKTNELEHSQMKGEASGFPVRVPGGCAPVLLMFLAIVLKYLSLVPGFLVTALSKKNIWLQ